MPDQMQSHPEVTQRSRRTPAPRSAAIRVTSLYECLKELLSTSNAVFGCVALLQEFAPRQVMLQACVQRRDDGALDGLSAWSGVAIPAQSAGCLLARAAHGVVPQRMEVQADVQLLPGLSFSYSQITPVLDGDRWIGLTALGSNQPIPADATKARPYETLARLLRDVRDQGPGGTTSPRAFETFLSELSSDLVSLPSNRIQTGIERALGRMGRLCKADRCYLFRFTEEGTRFECDSEWCSPGILPTITYMGTEPVAPYAWALAPLLRGQVLAVPDVSALPESAANVRDLWMEQGIQSLLNVPLCLGGQVLGFVGLDAVDTPPSWDDKMVTLLQQAAEILAHALERRRVGEEQRVQLQYLRGMERLNQVIQRTTELDAFLPDAMDEVRRILKVDRAWLLQVRQDDGVHLRVIAESTSPEFPGALAVGGDVPMREDARDIYQRLLSTEGPILLGPGGVGPTPESAKAFGVQSEVHMMLRPRLGAPWIFGLHHCAGERRWQPAEIALFRSIGYRLTDAISGMSLWRELRTSEARFRAFMENNPAMAFIKDQEGHYIYGNPAWQSQFGKTWEQLSGCTDHALFPREMADPIRASDLEVFKARVPMHFTQNRLNLNGDPISLSIHKFPILQADGATLLGGLIIDVSDIRRVQESLERSEARFRAMTENTSEITVILNAQRHFSYVSPAIQKTLGVKPRRVLGKPLTETFHPDDQDAVNAAIDRAYSHPGETIVIPEFRVRHRDGSWVTFETAITAMPDTPGVRGLVANCRDISERKRARDEQERLQAQIQHTQKLESLGVLAGGIAHDFNNLLMGIMGNADMARLHVPAADPAHEYLAGILKSTHRAADLCRQMLAYSGRGHFVIETLDLNALVREMLELLQISISKKVALSLALSEQPCTIRADATQIRQILMNLITNASEAMGDAQGQICVHTAVRHFEPSDFAGAQMGPLPAAGCYAYLEVADTGAGMDADTMQKMYDPFFTTKFTGRGLGMAAVLGIVRGHDGAILCRSALGRGTTFTVLFPAVDVLPQTAGTDEGEPQVAWKGQGCVLVVDDEPVVRRISGLMLEQLGLTIMEAENGREAIELLLEHPEGVACVLLDMTMPVMSGEEALQRMQQIRPNLPVVLMSGYNEQDATKRLATREFSRFLQKPFQLAQLASTLEGILGTPINGHEAQP